MTTHRMTLERPSPFRRRRFLAPHRRTSVPLILMRPFLVAVLLVALPLALGYWVLTAPLFLLSEVQIGGTNRVEPEMVMRALEPLQGRHLLALSLEEVEARLQVNPWIRGATIAKDLPNRLTVEIHEREPAALFRADGELFYIDRPGFVIAPYDPAGLVDVVLVSALDQTRLDVDAALKVAASFVRSAPDWGAGLSEVESLGHGDYVIHLADLSFPLLVRETDVEGQIQRLKQVFAEIEARYPRVSKVDLRFDGQIVIQPAAGPRNQEG